MFFGCALIDCGVDQCDDFDGAGGLVAQTQIGTP